ncbi:hypothetical protein PTQ46_28335, partial [Klebsiella michiganensis]|nr:hypothetical protein [Klebsiella michiganensis]
INAREPVARVRRLRRDPGKKYACSPWPNFRLQVHQRPRTGSPGKAFTPRPGKKVRLLPLT